MSEWLGNYGFFILVALMMLACHLGHGGRRGQGRREADGKTGDAQSGDHRR